MTPSSGFLASSFLVLLLLLSGCATSPPDAPRPQAFASDEATQLQAGMQRVRDLASQGRHAEAETELRRVLPLVERRFGPEHTNTLTGRFLLACTLLDQTRYPEAETELRSLLRVRDRTLGPAHGGSLQVQHCLARALQGQRKFQDAEAEYRTLHRYQEQALGPEHPHSLGSRTATADMLCGQNKFVEAESEYRVVLGLMERLLDRDNPATLATLTGLAFALSKQNKLPEAREMTYRAVTGARRKFGLGHPITKYYEKFYRDLNLNQMTPPSAPEDDKPK